MENEAEPRNMHYIITEIKNARFIRDIRVIGKLRPLRLYIVLRLLCHKGY
jgi:hypothetical protein